MRREEDGLRKKRKAESSISGRVSLRSAAHRNLFALRNLNIDLWSEPGAVSLFLKPYHIWNSLLPSLTRSIIGHLDSSAVTRIHFCYVRHRPRGQRYIVIASAVRYAR